KAGKVVMTLEDGETVLPPVPVFAVSLINPDCKVVLASSDNRLLAFAIGELKVMAKGRGLQLMNLAGGESLRLLNVMTSAEFVAESRGKRGGVHQERLRVQDIVNKRARKGKLLDISGELTALMPSATE
ncbi:MAG: DNA topoisomerase IV subunit A, partial [Neisseria sp.]|nr:DNA topoisomerase IV subunit A [Neisseria sp.]